MRTTDTTDGAALLRAIALFPDEDVPRLQYADHLDETATCESDRARAELIRVQCLLARLPSGLALCHVPDFNRPNMDVNSGPWHCKPDCSLCENIRLRDRPNELIRTHEPAWRRPACQNCEGVGRGMRLVKWTWALFECGACDGAGSTGPLSRLWAMDERHDAGLLKGGDRFCHAVTWVRGFPVVRCRLDEVWAGQWVKCGRCRGAGEILDTSAAEWDAKRACPTCQQQTTVEVEGPTPWAVRCVRECGATFEIADRRAPRDEGGYEWYDLPDELCVPETKGTFKTEPEALAALNSTVHRFVVRAAYPEVQS